MALHYGHVKTWGENIHQACCQCDWRGPIRIAKRTAENDAERHIDIATRRNKRRKDKK